jgi:predicted DNA-binding transcriptional regulator YafY
MRADRLISLMLLLNAHGRMTAGMLAKRLGVSERTIYRDLDALSASGIPIYTQGGVNGGVFLDEHYCISLTGFTSAELRVLFVSEGVGPLADLGLERAVTDTLLKLFAALPSSHQAEVERLRGRFHIDPANWFQVSAPSPFLPILQHAVWEDRAVAIRYQVVEGQVYEGVVNPYALVAKANVWYLVAEKSAQDADDESGALRNYRLGRLKAVALSESHFERDPDFDLAAYWTESCAQFERLSSEQFPPFYATLRV